ncbi:MAG: hypothetical protein WC616_01410 [Candidatus Omnitrophota bacterium]
MSIKIPFDGIKQVVDKLLKSKAPTAMEEAAAFMKSQGFTTEEYVAKVAANKVATAAGSFKVAVGKAVATVKTPPPVKPAGKPSKPISPEIEPFNYEEMEKNFIGKPYLLSPDDFQDMTRITEAAKARYRVGGSRDASASKKKAAAIYAMESVAKNSKNIRRLHGMKVQQAIKEGKTPYAGWEKDYPELVIETKAKSVDQVTPNIPKAPKEIAKEAYQMRQKELFTNEFEEAIPSSGSLTFEQQVKSWEKFFNKPYPYNKTKMQEMFKEGHFSGLPGKGNMEMAHRGFIKQALSEGKTVPPEVLRDYPDLVKVEHAKPILPEIKSLAQDANEIPPVKPVAPAPGVPKFIPFEERFSLPAVATIKPIKTPVKTVVSVKKAGTLSGYIKNNGGIRIDKDRGIKYYQKSGLLGALNKTGRGLDEWAVDLESAGLIPRIPSNMNPSDHLFEQLVKQKGQRLQGSKSWGKQLDDEYDSYYARVNEEAEHVKPPIKTPPQEMSPVDTAINTGRVNQWVKTGEDTKKIKKTPSSKQRAEESTRHAYWSATPKKTHRISVKPAKNPNALPVRTVIEELNALATKGISIKLINQHANARAGVKTADDLIRLGEEERLMSIAAKKRAFDMEKAMDTEAKLATITKGVAPIKIDTRTIGGKFKYAKYLVVRGLGKFEIPQHQMARIGVKEIFYDPLRKVERIATQTGESLQGKYAPFWNKTTEAEKEMFSRYQFGLQGEAYIKAIKRDGLKPVGYEELSPRMKAAADIWKKDRDSEFTPTMRAVMERHGETAPILKEYFPLQINEKIKFLDKGSSAHVPSKSEAFFESLIKREKPVSYNDYEHNPSKILHEHFANYAKYIHMADETAKAKNLISHPEFVRKLGKTITQDMEDRLKLVVNPAPISPVARWMERAVIQSLLGLNPITIAKQNLSFIDLALTTKGYKYNVPPGLVSVAHALGSVMERVPDIAIHGHEAGAISRVTLGGIAKTDRFVAKHNMARVLYPEFKRLVGDNPEFYVALKNPKLDESGLIQALNKAGVSKEKYDDIIMNISDTIDAAMGGVTAMQRPMAYTSTTGRLFTILTSTMNSRFQYLMKKGVISVKEGDPVMVSRLLTATILASYGETAMTGLTPTPGASKVLQSAASGVPLIGSLAFSLSTHQGYTPAAIDGFNRALKSVERAYSNPDVNNIALALTRSAEFAGLPRQFGKTHAGLTALSEGNGDWRQIIKGKSYAPKGKD